VTKKAEQTLTAHRDRKTLAFQRNWKTFITKPKNKLWLPKPTNQTLTIRKSIQSLTTQTDTQIPWHLDTQNATISFIMEPFKILLLQKSKYCNTLIKQRKNLPVFLLLSASHSLTLVRPVVLISCSCFLIQFLIEWSLFQFIIEERSKMQEEKMKL
jgi:hypothetical protein